MYNIIECVQLFKTAKVGIKSCRFAGGCVSFMHGCNYPDPNVFEQTHVVSTGNAGWRVMPVC